MLAVDSAKCSRPASVRDKRLFATVDGAIDFGFVAIVAADAEAIPQQEEACFGDREAIQPETPAAKGSAVWRWHAKVFDRPQCGDD